MIGHLRHPIASPFMGGMEAHCHQLVSALVARGHSVTLFASGDSDPALPLHPIVERHYDAELPWALWNSTPRLAQFLSGAFECAWAAVTAGEFDVVHNNSMDPALHHWARRDRQPMVTSLHVPPFATLFSALCDEAAPWAHQTVTSEAHLASWWANPPATASVVYNGIDTDRWTFRPNGNGRAVWAGRITPNKGTAIALDAAKYAGIALDVIGPIDCSEYFQAEVVPRLDQERVYHGHMQGAELVRMVGESSVLLATPTWDEPFGLIAAEAMACGVPVAALDRGALREVIGACGVLASDARSLADAIVAARRISRAACRQRVEQAFSIRSMIEGYEHAYAAAMAGARASSNASTVALLA
ncbi:glycosyltransferase [Sphingomonas sp. M1-B02]|uniref:glycosyltransferase n=1 Tax=Sphingomonas sp. M1-B02 TaxID=3114300 RepID=UPI00223FE018|nr:glycosyltransferase [Sphingomonas sp. S6-11]UZK67820.1 glycosyltransferase [Sphingomonas sp. S6-11]